MQVRLEPSWQSSSDTHKPRFPAPRDRLKQVLQLQYSAGRARRITSSRSPTVQEFKVSPVTRDPILTEQKNHSKLVLATSEAHHPTTGKLGASVSVTRTLLVSPMEGLNSAGHRSHGLLTQPGQEPSHLQQGVHTFRHFHVSVSDLLQRKPKGAGG